MTARLLMAGQPAFLEQAGFDVRVMAAPGPDLEAVAAREGVAVEAVPLARSIRPLKDLRALLHLWRAFRRLRPAIVNAGTPKAGLLAMLAARLAEVPVRVYTLRGLRLETVGGFRRRLLGASERLASRLAQRVVCVSPSLRRRCLELRLAPAGKTLVLGTGSSNGVDAERFAPAAAGDEELAALRRRLGLPEGATVIGFVGRFTRDKGIEDLAEAFCERLAPRFPGAWLLLVGEFEEGDPVAGPVVERLAAHRRVVHAGFVADSAPYYRVMDVLAFPSYREGFPNAPLEAAASAVPVAGYAAVGTVDAVAGGETGLLAAVGDVAGLEAALARYLDDPALRRRHGAAARQRALRLFARERVWRAWAEEYRRLLGPGRQRHERADG